MIVEAVRVVGALWHDSSRVFELHGAPMYAFLLGIV